ncbi:MAG: deoxyribose-phosphate aldolase [Bacteroidales bacterium]|nr:deoxyribose-phosphate aldolase [Bacteroidales bacterium]
MKFICPELPLDTIKEKLDEYLKIDVPFENQHQLNQFILNVIDHTSLEGTDNEKKIQDLCHQALDIKNKTGNQSTVAAVCVYPVFAETAKRELQNTEINIACVAGAFPSAQSPMHLRVEEANYAVASGATEIDMVISRGQMLDDNYRHVYHEIHEIKKTIGNTHLKVILETGELKDINIIRKAAEIAIQAGADFIKTSTGKIKPAATLEAYLAMLDVIKTYYYKENRKIGIKPAGGISDPEAAKDYIRVLYGHLGKDWLNKKLFRIGASRLTTKIVNEL